MNGVTATAECFTAFTEMKLRKTNRFIVYKLSQDERNIEIDQRGESDASFDDFVSVLPSDACRYAVLALSVETKSGATDPNRLLFVSWCPSGAHIRAKMMHAASKAALKNGLSGLSNEYSAGNPGELAYDEMYLKAGGVPGEQLAKRLAAASALALASA